MSSTPAARAERDLARAERELRVPAGSEHRPQAVAPDGGHAFSSTAPAHRIPKVLYIGSTSRKAGRVPDEGSSALKYCA